MNIAPRDYQSYFWGALFAGLLLLICYLSFPLVDIVMRSGKLCVLLVDHEVLSPGGAVTHIIQFAAFFAALRALTPSTPIDMEIGRSIFIA